MSANRSELFSELSQVLKMRRNIEAALMDPELIGSESGPAFYESFESFQERIKNKRIEARRENKEFLIASGLKTRSEAESEIRRLRSREAELWKILGY